MGSGMVENEPGITFWPLCAQATMWYKGLGCLCVGLLLVIGCPANRVEWSVQMYKLKNCIMYNSNEVQDACLWVHPCIDYIIFRILLNHRESGVNQSWLQTGGGVTPWVVLWASVILTFTPTGNLEQPSDVIRMSMGCRRKPTLAWRERFEPGTFMLWAARVNHCTNMTLLITSVAPEYQLRHTK